MMWRRALPQEDLETSREGRTRRERVLRWLAGPRFIDLPIRALAVFYALTAFLPSATESQDPLYLVFFYGARALYLVATFLPFSAGLAGMALLLVFMALFPEYLNPMQEPVEFAAAILLSQMRWVPWIVLLLAVIGQNVLAFVVTPMVAMPYWLLGYTTLRNTLLALAGAAGERRLRREIALREQAARGHERQLQRERTGFAVDTHDTVSHGLATQAAMVRLLAAEKDEGERRQLLSELSLTNDEIQHQLRVFLAKLRADEGVLRSPAADAEEEFRRTGETLRRAAESGGIRLEMEIDLPPRSLPAAMLDQLAFIMRELVTNMVKHTSGSDGCRLSVGLSRDDSGVLLIESVNPSDAAEATTPRSLSLRASALDGSCSASCRDGSYRVAVRLPIGTENIP